MTEEAAAGSGSKNGPGHTVGAQTVNACQGCGTLYPIGWGGRGRDGSNLLCLHGRGQGSASQSERANYDFRRWRSEHV